MLRHEKLDGTARRIQLLCVEIGLTIERRVARREQQGIAFA